MARKGKMSSIRLNSNKNFNFYDKDGTLKLDKLNKKDRKRYLESIQKSEKRIEEENRPPKVRRKVNGEWVETIK